MKFHEYRLLRNAAIASATGSSRMPESWKRLSLQQFYDNMLIIMKSEKAIADETRHRICLEAGYIRCQRPFYNVYSAVERCLENTKLNLELKQLPEFPEIVAMCFAEGSEPSINDGKVHSMLVSFSPASVALSTGKTVYGPRLNLCADMWYKAGRNTTNHICCAKTGLISDYAAGMHEHSKLVSLAVGLILLAQDERFLEPVLLQQDQGRQLNAAELERAIARAKKRGRNGMTIGKGLEVSPHTRMPHMAIRWTGTGRAIPRLVPVKGCVVSRNKLFPVPTGHLDEQLKATKPEESKLDA